MTIESGGEVDGAWLTDNRPKTIELGEEVDGAWLTDNRPKTIKSGGEVVVVHSSYS